MLTDTALRKWVPTKNQEINRCGEGLYVRGFTSGRKLFQIRIMIDGKRKWVDIGEYPTRTLAEAREAALTAKRLLKSGEVTASGIQAALIRGTKLIDIKDEAMRSPSEDRSGIPTFSKSFREWYTLQLKANTWRHKASARFPIKAFELHAEKHIGNLRLDKITRPIIKKFMQPLFLSNPETARKLLGYMHTVFEGAYDNEFIDHNPCPRKESFTAIKRKINHSSSLHFERLPELFSWLLEAPFSEPVKTAMELAVLSAHRASVVANMRWDNLDEETGIWTIPEAPVGIQQGFMKSGNEFSMRIPAELFIKIIALPRKCDFVFSVDGKRPINAETLRRNFQKFDNITTHGFRNTFKTWCLHHEIDGFLADRYVDHSLKGLDKNYRRDDLFQKRAALAKRYWEYAHG